MKAVRVHVAGGPERLSLEVVAEPHPGAGEVLVRVEAAGVNYIDVYQRTGVYPASLPLTLGQEAAGLVAELGAGVSGFGRGDRVAWAGILGAYAEMAVVPADRLVPVPEGVTTRQAAAALLQGMTAHYLACTTRPLAAGDACLVHAAAGGVGGLLCQVAKRRGARVIATASGEEKVAIARENGADEVIDYGRQDFAAEVLRLTAGRGVQVVYDSVGRATFEAGLACLAPRGMMVLFGQSSGAVAALDPQVLARRGSLYLTRPTLAHYVAGHEELIGRAGDVLGWVGDGTLRLCIDSELALAAAPAAHRRLEGRESRGKILLLP